MTAFGSHLRFVLRSLARNPMFSAVTVLTLALGIGATSAVFSVVHGVLLKPLPFAEADRLVGIWHTAPGMGWDQVNQSPALYFTYREESATFEDSGMYSEGTVSVTELGEPEEVEAMWVTDGILPVLRARPLAGRLFTAEDDSPGTAQTVILSHRYWQERFAGERSAVGRTVKIDGEPHEVIGVMGPELHFLDYDPALYLPFRFDRAEVYFGNFSYSGLGRLAPGATLEQANDEVARMIPMALERFPLPEGFTRAMVEEIGFGPQLHSLKQDVVGDVGRMLWLLLGTVGIVLLVACANVANLLLVRSESRQQELAVRTALGAGRRRIGAELLLENVVLALAGGIAGLILAYSGLRLLAALAPRGLPRVDEIGIDPVVLLFTLAVSLLAAAGVGALPILRLGGARVVAALKEGGRGGGAGRARQMARNTLVGAQVALALVLIIGSGLMIRSFQALRRVDPGFRAAAEVQTLRLSVPETEAETSGDSAALHEEILRKLEALPGVTAAGLSSSLPMDGWNSMDPIFVEDFPMEADAIPPLRRFKWVSPGFRTTLGTPLVAGRDISWADLHDRAEVAVVSESFAREYWGEPEAALGRRIRPYPNSTWRRIVGVVGAVHDTGVDEEAPEIVYWPLITRAFVEDEEVPFSTRRSLAYAIRSPRVGAPGFLDEVRTTIWSVNPHLPLANVRTLDEILTRSLARTSFTLVMLAIAAVTALLLGAIGIYGVTSYAVAQRRREIGVRMALGAQRRDVSGLVLRHGLVLAGAGAVAGLAGAVGVTRLMSALLFGINAVDPATYALGGLGVIAIALVASYLPARRAAAVDPIETLR